MKRVLIQGTLAAGAFLLAAALQAAAFTEPSANPPQGNVAAPLNTGSASQDKSGWITADGIGTRYGALLATNSGNVGIGTVSPAQKLDVAGYTNSQGFCLNGSCITSWNEAGSAPVTCAANWYTVPEVNTAVYFPTGVVNSSYPLTFAEGYNNGEVHILSYTYVYTCGGDGLWHYQTRWMTENNNGPAWYSMPTSIQ